MRGAWVKGYYPGGMPQPGRSYNSNSYRYGFNGMEKDDEVKGTGNSLDFGARIYDSRLSRWLSLDPLQHEYPSQSDYSFALNNPIICVDKDGKKVYIVIDTGGSSDASDAARTRSSEIMSSPTFDPKTDHVYMLEVTDLGDIAQQVQNVTESAAYNGFGKTVEVSFFGHAGQDGPAGTSEASGEYNLAKVTGNALDGNQISPNGWKNIDFNFDSDESIACFYGCKVFDFAEAFLSYQPNLAYSTGLGGGGGGSYTFEGGFDSAWFPSSTDNVYMVDLDPNDDETVLPKLILGREVDWDLQKNFPRTDVDGNNVYHRKSSGEVYGNPTVDPDTKEVKSGSGS